MALVMRNLLPSTASVGNVVCILDLLETLAPDLQRTTHRTEAIQPIVQLTCTTALQFYATGSFQRECGDVHGPSYSCVSRCIGAVSKRYGLLFSTSSRRTATSSVQFSFFVFKFVLILCVLLYTSTISLHVVKHVVFVAICGHCKINRTILMKRKIMS